MTLVEKSRLENRSASLVLVYPPYTQTKSENFSFNQRLFL